MATEVVQRGIAIRMACAVFSVSESCYRYESRQNAENEEIANWLLRLTDNLRNCGLWAMLPGPAQREEIRMESQTRLSDLPIFFLGRLLPVDAQVADRWSRLQASAARPLPAIGGLLAATALQHDLTLVSHNVKDFIGLNLKIINPWEVI
jgi:hypothetical protein